jgi:hypothetical protein
MLTTQLKDEPQSHQEPAKKGARPFLPDSMLEDVRINFSGHPDG